MSYICNIPLIPELRDLFPTTTPAQSRPNDLRPGRKKQSKPGRNRKYEQRHDDFSSSSDDLDQSAHEDGGNNVGGITTQTLGGGGQQSTRGQQRTERPNMLPSASPPWINVSAGVARSRDDARPTLLTLSLCAAAIITWRDLH